MLSAMYAHTCESCGDTGLIIFDQDKTHIDPCKCEQGRVGGTPPPNGVLTKYYQFFFENHASYKPNKYSDFCQNEIFFRFSDLSIFQGIINLCQYQITQITIYILYLNQSHLLALQKMAVQRIYAAMDVTVKHHLIMIQTLSNNTKNT